MRIRTIGLAALMAGPLMIGGSYAQQTLEDEIQQEEAPGSAIETEISPGRVIIGRQRNLNPSPVEIQGQTLDAPNDPDTPGVARRRSTPSCRARDLRISPVPTTTIRSPTDELKRRPGWPRRRRPPVLWPRLFRGVSSPAA